MKPRRVLFTIEVESSVPIDRLRRVYALDLYERDGGMLDDTLVESPAVVQLHVNVIKPNTKKSPVAKKKAKRK